jgi:hypothetical protein
MPETLIAPNPTAKDQSRYFDATDVQKRIDSQSSAGNNLDTQADFGLAEAAAWAGKADTEATLIHRDVAIQAAQDIEAVRSGAVHDPYDTERSALRTNEVHARKAESAAFGATAKERQAIFQEKEQRDRQVGKIALT